MDTILLKELHEHRVRILTECTVSKIQDKGLVIVDKDDKETFLEAEGIIISIGSRPDNALFDQIKTSGYEIHRIGDCLEPRSAKAAIYEGALLGRSI